MSGESKLLEGLVERWRTTRGHIAAEVLAKDCAAQLEALIPQAVAAAKLEEAKWFHLWGAHPDNCPKFCLGCQRIAELERLAAATGEESHD